MKALYRLVVPREVELHGPALIQLHSDLNGERPLAFELREGRMGRKRLEPAALAAARRRCINDVPAIEIILARQRPIEIALLARQAELGERRKDPGGQAGRSEEHTSELQSLMRISYAVFCLKKKKQSKHI